MEEMESVWACLDECFAKAERSIKSSAEDVWEFYHEVSCSSAKSSYGSKMEYYSAVAARYGVSDRTVRNWVTEGKRAKEDFINKGTLSSIRWEELKSLPKQTESEVTLSNDDLAESLDGLVDLEEMIINDDEFKLDRINTGGGGGGVSGSTGDGPSNEYGDRSELIAELEVYRSLGYSSPHEALVEVAKFRDLSPVEKVLEKQDFEFLTEALHAAAETMDFQAVSRMTSILNNLRKLVN